MLTKKMIHANTALALVLAATTVACGATPPPKELVDARAAYQQAANGPANQVNPAQVHVAKESLDIAEKSFDEDPSAPETRDRAYIALRKAELADAQAGQALAEQARDKAQKDLQDTQIAMGQKAQQELGQTRQQLNKTTEQLAAEKKAREEAEKHLKESMDALAKMATIKQDTRGTVITLSGSVLFASNKSDLLPAAMIALDNVVTAIKSDPSRNVTINGYTDSQGAKAYNQELSQKRADSVRNYFIQHGIDAGMVKAVGFGPDSPIADNGTAEGRANNRRVEIVLSPAEHK
ncbi:MAG: OmpA family protein [Polyangiaceae bacterium]